MTDATRLLLMAEFGTEEPLWLLSPEGKAFRGISLERLPLTTGLKQRIGLDSGLQCAVDEVIAVATVVVGEHALSWRCG